MRPTRRSSHIAIGLCSLLVLAIVISLAIATWVVREQAVREWRLQLANLSLVLAEQTSQEVTSAYLVLDSIAESVQSAGVRNDAELRASVGGAAMFNSLRDKTRGLPQVDEALILAANGDVVSTTRELPAPAISLAERESFQQHLLRGGAAVYVSAPVRDPVSGHWTFYLSRRLDGADGRFIGVAMVGFSSTFLSEFYKKIALGEGAVLTLYRRDFTVLARWPHADALMGRHDGKDAAARLVGAAAGNDEVELAKVTVPGTARQQLQMSAPRLLDKYPFIVNIAIGDKLFLAQWRHFSTVLMLVGGFSVSAIVLAFVLLINSLRRRERDMEATERLVESAQAASRAKSEFLAMMSHEIRTPLTSIIGFAELLGSKAEPELRAEAGQIILRNGQHLLSVINDILDISKIEAGRLRLEQVAFSPLETIWGIEAMMRTQAASKGIEFAIVVEYPFPSQVQGDPTRWKQILFNLCSNAVKFTELGSVQVTLWYDAGDARLVCNVVDTGIGISDAQRAKLFMPFSQADGDITRRYGGTGLGLHLVQELANKMDGKVSVASELGKGSVFEVDVAAPLAEGAAWLAEMPVQAAQPARLQKAAPPRLRGRVLLAEDGPDNRTLIGAFLTRLGLDYLMADNGAEAVEMGLANQVDVVLMDIQMPVMDGMAATALLRAAGMGVPIVALTANVMPEDVAHYLSSGFSYCVGKPIDFAQLGQLLGDLLGEQPGAPVDGMAPAELEGFGQIRAAFEASLPLRLAQLSGHLDEPDGAAAREVAHMLKGAAGSFGYPEVTRLAGAIERSLRAGQREQAQQQMSELLALEELRALQT